MPSTAARIWAGWLLVPGWRAPVTGSMSKPNLVAITTRSRIGGQRLSHQRFVGEGAIRLGGVEVGDAKVMRAADQG